MKNKKIKVGDTVPAPLRRKIYRQAIKHIQNDGVKFDDHEHHICWMLPCLLWGLNRFSDKNPSGEEWHDTTSHRMFPEWTMIRRMDVVDCDWVTDRDKNQVRIKHLTEMIHESRRKNS